MILTNKELCNITGGGYGWFVVIGSVVTLLIGIVDGIFRPLKCNE